MQGIDEMFDKAIRKNCKPSITLTPKEFSDAASKVGSKIATENALLTGDISFGLLMASETARFAAELTHVLFDKEPEEQNEKLEAHDETLDSSSSRPVGTGQ